MALKYNHKRGEVFRNIHTKAWFIVTHIRPNCGFPLYYLKLIDDKIDKRRFKVDDSMLEQHYTKHAGAKAIQVLYGV